MNTKTLVFLLLCLSLFFASCTNDDDGIIAQPSGDYANGLLISHEGNFGQGNASVSYVSYDFQTVENNVFSNVNGTPLGDSAQSIAFDGDLAYIVLNVSNKIEVVNRYSFESVATITSGLNNPRYMAIANGKGYVTNWGDGGDATDDYLAVIDLSNNAITSQVISVEEGPEKIVGDGNRLYVAHQGGFSQNNIVSVIDAMSNSVSATIEVGDVPNSMQLDAAGNLWVLSGGKPAYTNDETAGKISKINTNTNTVTSLDFAMTEHPNLLNIDNGQVYYYLAGSVYKMDATAIALPTSAQLTGLNFYGMLVENEIVYGLDAVDFSSNGSLNVYDLNTNTEVESIELNIIPGEVYLN
ncbi:YncE family protein [Subsaximicrobium wynnwilliamsii]|uniref:YncE family protein n=1 Tax=Subsaximicrobium wynnwilliamsii TaxID=291179 RepID=A0A5C6ZKH1_9FLAO|nr:DUF5074 domain-containing protein [Subsaximicrobium wynnwilliamsii]TXD84699.1 YncE family protein [Subsaximicrobium wynnwilliamsii]TXD90369.1 YncE family protein [Subsaximicrobium wynnwilliamsii]TXE04845.1 YncE family protein [Subsaximicrobium wynnwilliamsii]